GEEVESLCNANGIDFDECRLWYDGYRQHGFEIYNPESVVKSLRKKVFGSYWGQTSTYEAITDRIRQNFAGTREAVIRMLAGEEVDVNVTRFMNTMTSFHTKDDLFTYLIHLGYLAYDEDNETCRVPNREVMQEWQNAVSIDSDYSVTNRIISQSKLLLKETFEGNAEAVALALDESHINVASNRSYNSEDVLQSAIYLAYIYALNKYTIVREMTAGKGFADVVYIPVKNDVPAMIVELKRNGCVDSALNQIRERKYFMSLEHYHGDLLFVAINYDERTKRHECVIDKFEK
ncbi:MAG: PD-(D/E)XK nuclease domain-containing protein, partial [Bacteroidales bacterium]|nr:PD-(D/E)XK nuclease domain-containing protein [Bacteroidales bacterium]